MSKSDILAIIEVILTKSQDRKTNYLEMNLPEKSNRISLVSNDSKVLNTESVFIEDFKTFVTWLIQSNIDDQFTMNIGHGKAHDRPD